MSLPVITNRLRNRKNVRFGERAVKRSAAMTAGAEADELVGVGYIGLAGVILAFEPREIDEHGLGRRFAGKR